MISSVLFPPVELSPREFLRDLCLTIDEQAGVPFGEVGDAVGVSFGVTDRVELIADPDITFWRWRTLRSGQEIELASQPVWRQQQCVLQTTKLWLRAYPWHHHNLAHIAAHAAKLPPTVDYDTALVTTTKLVDRVLYPS